MPKFKETPSQTAGPYVHIGCRPMSAGLKKRGLGEELGSSMVSDISTADTITLDIQIIDGADELVKDALIEIWQASPEGHYQTENGFLNWGRQTANLETGHTLFKTLKPGKIECQAPHILVWIVARGINLGLTTRIYFGDEDNSSDAVFKLAGERAHTLVASKTDSGYAHTIYLQGQEETVFFDV